MKRIVITVFCVCFCLISRAQEISLYSQKLTNSLIYNPAMAGQAEGSLMYAYKQMYNGVGGAPKNHLLSFQMPLTNRGKANLYPERLGYSRRRVVNSLGVGANLYQEEIAFLRGIHSSVDFAYHLSMSKFRMLSMGVSAEYHALSAYRSLNFATDPDDDLNKFQDGIRKFDFSFGLHYESRYARIGVATNRLATTWLTKDLGSIFTSYYSLYVQGLIPSRRNNDLLEPCIAVRKISETEHIVDLGAFYTYDNILLFGISVRNGKSINTTIGLKLSRGFQLGYSRETMLRGFGGSVRGGNELTLHIDFKENNYKKRFSPDYNLARPDRKFFRQKRLMRSKR